MPVLQNHYPLNLSFNNPKKWHNAWLRNIVQSMFCVTYNIQFHLLKLKMLLGNPLAANKVSNGFKS